MGSRPQSIVCSKHLMQMLWSFEQLRFCTFAYWLSLRHLTSSLSEQHGNHDAERGDNNCNHTAKQLHQHCNLGSFMRRSIAISMSWLESSTTSTTRLPLCVRRSKNRSSQTRRISRAKRPLPIPFLQIVFTSLKIRSIPMVASYIPLKTRSKPWKIRPKLCKTLSLP